MASIGGIWVFSREIKIIVIRQMHMLPDQPQSEHADKMHVKATRQAHKTNASMCPKNMDTFCFAFVSAYMVSKDPNTPIAAMAMAILCTYGQKCTVQPPVMI